MSPHNVFLGYDGQVKVLDFGIAKGGRTPTRDARGRPWRKASFAAYMAQPEQATGKAVDARTDLFSVGVMLWEAATDRRFWSGAGTETQILRALLCGDLDDEHHRATAQLPADVRALVAKATALEPSARHDSAASLLADVRAVLARHGRGEPVGAAEVGDLVRDLFAGERARLQAAIDGVLSHSRGKVSGKFSVSDVRALPADVDVPSLNMALGEGTLSKVPVLQATSIGSSAPAATSSRLEAPTAAGATAGCSVWSGAGLVGGLAVIGGASLPLVATPRVYRGRRPPPLGKPRRHRRRPRRPATRAPPIDKVHVVIRASPAQARIVARLTTDVFDNPCVAFACPKMARSIPSTSTRTGICRETIPSKRAATRPSTSRSNRERPRCAGRRPSARRLLHLRPRRPSRRLRSNRGEWLPRRPAECLCDESTQTTPTTIDAGHSPIAVSGLPCAH